MKVLVILFLFGLSLAQNAPSYMAFSRDNSNNMAFDIVDFQSPNPLKTYTTPNGFSPPPTNAWVYSKQDELLYSVSTTAEPQFYSLLPDSGEIKSSYPLNNSFYITSIQIDQSNNELYGTIEVDLNPGFPLYSRIIKISVDGSNIELETLITIEGASTGFSPFTFCPEGHNYLFTVGNYSGNYLVKYNVPSDELWYQIIPTTLYDIAIDSYNSGNLYAIAQNSNSTQQSSYVALVNMTTGELTTLYSFNGIPSAAYFDIDLSLYFVAFYQNNGSLLYIFDLKSIESFSYNTMELSYNWFNLAKLY